GLDEAVDVGPLANPRRLKAMEELIQDAVEQGATVACGGEPGPTPGFFWQPTVLENVPDSARIMNEEPFGPVALLRKVDTLEEAIEHANRLPYGLASYAFTRDSLTRSKLSRGIQAGMLGINSLHISMPEAPFGGIKESGLGSECGIEGLLAYCNVKLVSED
ncbi:MAG: aldehyde dehydrogenase family protein, partial [Alcaligenaceae bacterium]|nr:aldehyde dehydrogenase family protein [Alcaligenaceae bacterium]